MDFMRRITAAWYLFGNQFGSDVVFCITMAGEGD